ncbi:hemerythrin [Varunaivibrio sulfuroxidans]|uniref:Hemerythrin n=2 Tax=Varunaivibrio sulfuroxidans TaxID=1773489 RepID=A0A4R3J5X7_9PROT|nr:hemerythrin [Varunaivibrio sulfuroxidans]
MGWKAKYTTGITLLDDEHKELLELVNTLISALESPNEGAATHAHVIDGYRKVHDHIVAHFADEERLMHNIGFPDVTEHITQHEALRQELEQLGKMIKEGRTPENWEPLASMLNVWVLRHIMSHDVKIRTYLHRSPS